MTAVQVAPSAASIANDLPSRSLVQVDADTLYQIYKESGGDVGYKKSTDGGATWGSFIDLFGGASDDQWYDVYYDKWRGSDAGIIHVATADDAGTRGIFYNAIDTADDSLHSASGTLAVGLGSLPGVKSHSLAVSKSGTIYVAGRRFQALGEVHAKSEDGGTTWTTGLAHPNENPDDRLIGWADYSSADPDDYLVLFWDNSASEITVKQYDASADTWSESSAITGMDLAEGRVQWGSTLRRSDGHILLTAFDGQGTTGVTLKSFDISGSTITAKSDVLASGDFQMVTNVSIDIADNVICWYARDSAGAAHTAMEVYYKVSTDGMASWGSETAYGTRDSDVSAILADPIPTGATTNPAYFETNVADIWIETDGVAIQAEVTLTVTRADMTEDEVREVAGDQTIVLTLMGATWDADVGGNAAETEDLICGLLSAGTEIFGWNNVVLGGTCYSAAVLADSPAGYWRLGDASGDAADLSGNGNDGTYEGTQETGLGLIPNSAQLSTKFNDVLTKVMVPDTASAIDGIFDSGGTAEALIRPWSDGGGDQGRIFAKNDTNGGWEFTVYNQSSGFARLQFRHDFSSTDGVWVTAVAVPLSKASHVTVVYDNSDVANRPTIYINGGTYTVENGGLLEINAPVGTRVSDASSDLYIGNTASVQGALHFRGEIQEAALYTSELSKTRILEHLKAASNPFGLSHADVVRTSDTVVTITLPAFPLYDISVTETITVTAVASTHSGSEDVVGTPTFDITPTDYVSPYNPGSGDPGGGGPGGTDNPGGSEDNPPDGSTGGGGPGDGTGGGAGGDDDFGGFNGGLGSQSPQANRTLGDGDTYSFGLAGLGVGLDPGGRIRVIRIDAAEISESS